MKGIDLLFNVSAIIIVIVSLIAYYKIKFGQKEYMVSSSKMEHLSLRPTNNKTKKEDIIWKEHADKAA